MATRICRKDSIGCLANDLLSSALQQRLFLTPETKLYRALTSGKCIDGERVTDKAFRLRPPNAEFPAETTLSVALTPEKAMGNLDCKGYAAILVGDVERIDGLAIQRKADDAAITRREIVASGFTVIEMRSALPSNSPHSPRPPGTACH